MVRTRGFRSASSAVARNAASLSREASAARDVLTARLRHGRPQVVLTYWGGIGDELMRTVICRELRRRGFGPAWVFSSFPDLYVGNDDVAAVLPRGPRHHRWIKRLGGRPLIWRYSRYVPEEDRVALLAPERHIITVMCQLVGIVGPITRRPYLALTDEERAAGALVPRQVVIQSSGMARWVPMQNKQWFPERFQEVVTALRGELDFVQLGDPSDPPLEGVLDLRGQTSRRQSAAILSQSLAYVGNVGFLMHLARAVECRSVILYGGRERPDQSGYGCNENLYGDVPCAPCWLRNRCDFDRRCMREIGAADVIDAVRRVVAKHGAPLEVDADVIPAEGFEATGRGRAMLNVLTPTGEIQRTELKVLADAVS